MPQNNNVTRNKQCLICQRHTLLPYLSLGKTALANAYLEKSALTQPEMKIPLKVAYCPNCHLSQLTHNVSRELLFKNYPYFSSTSPQLIDHFEKYAQDLLRRFPNQTKKLTVEIASNDGILLKPLQKAGGKVLGVDSAENIANQANSEGVPTIPLFFTEKVAEQISQNYGKAGIITANNVLAHTDQLQTIMRGINILLDENGVFVSQSKYLADLMKQNAFDTIYHEHLSYFSLSSFKFLLEKHNLKIIDVQHAETEGGSLRIFATHNKSKLKISANVQKILKQEENLKQFQTYQNWAKNPARIKQQLQTIIRKNKKQGKKISAYGASAKGNTLLQFCNINQESIDYIVDNAPSKQGKYTPGSHILIVPPEYFRQNPPDLCLLLAWNFADSIIEKESWFKTAHRNFLLPIPQPHLR